MDEYIDAPLSALFHDGVALLDFIGVHYDVARGGDGRGVFLRSAGDQKDIIAAHFADLVEAGLCARNGLAHNDRLHIGVGAKRNQLGNGGFHFSHESIGIGIGDDVIAVLRLRLLRGAEFFFALGGGAGQDCDLPVAFFSSCDYAHAQNEGKNQYEAKQFLHGSSSIPQFLSNADKAADRFQICDRFRST